MKESVAGQVLPYDLTMSAGTCQATMRSKLIYAPATQQD